MHDRNTYITLSDSAAPQVCVAPGMEVVPESSDKYTYTPGDRGWPQDRKEKIKSSGAGAFYADDEERRICGLRRKWFFLSCLGAVVVICLAAVGGGVAGVLHNRSRSNTAANQTQTPLANLDPITTTTSPPTTTTPSSPSSTPTSQTDILSSCPSSNMTFFTPSNAANWYKPYTLNGTTLQYRIHCNKNYADKTSGSNPGVTKLAQLDNLPGLKDCITACASLNQALFTSSGMVTGAGGAGSGGKGRVPGWRELCSGVVMRRPLGKASMCDLNSGVAVGNVSSLGMDKEWETTSAILEWDSKGN